MASGHREPPTAPPELWQRPDMVEALAARDMGTVVKMFRQWTGSSQTDVGMAVGMPQSHVSDIERGNRQVSSLDMFERFSAGLGIPRAMLGLADPTAPVAVPPTVAKSSTPQRSDSQRRRTPATIGGIDPVEDSVRQSRAFLTRASGSLNPILIEQFADDVGRLSTTYLSQPPSVVLPEATALRERAFVALDDGRRPTEMRDLYLIAGQLSGILAYAALDLDRPDAAMTNARSALLCAELAGHTELAAWTRGTQALIARYTGRFHEAHRFIKAGLDYNPAGTAKARLTSGEAQCLAHFGQADATHDALARARGALDSAEPDEMGGLFTFTQAKLAYYAGSSLIWLPGADDARVAETESAQAIRLFADGPVEESDHSDRTTAHIYLATARVLRGEIDGTLEALKPVLAIPRADRVSWHRQRLGRLADLLAQQRYRGSTVAGRARAEIDAFRREPRALPAN